MTLNTFNRFPIPTDVLLSLATGPVLLGLVVYSSLTKIQIGQASEEVFRGDRLPIIPVPASEREASAPS